MIGVRGSEERFESKLPSGPRRPALFQVLEWIRRPVELMYDCRRRFGSRFTLRFTGGRSFVFLSDPADVKAIFAGSPDVLWSGRANQAFQAFVGEQSLLVLDGETHRRHRRLLGPPFRGDSVASYGGMIREVTEADMATWPRNQPFPIMERMRSITLTLICKAIFGADDSGWGGRVERVKALAQGLMESAGNAAVFLKALQVDLGPRSPWGRFVRARNALVEDFRRDVRDLRRDSSHRSDVLARLLEESKARGEPLSDDEVESELLSLLAAGHETTTCALAWAFEFILRDGEAVERILPEAEALLESNGAALEKPSTAPFLKACISETLRLVPPIPIVVRYANESFEFQGMRVPKGTYLAPCAFLAHRDGSVFSDPEAFRPTRFLERKPAPYEFFPFGGGNRLCIGASFAMYEMAIILATVLRNARVRLAASEAQGFVRSGILLNPSRGTPVRILD